MILASLRISKIKICKVGPLSSYIDQLLQTLFYLNLLCFFYSHWLPATSGELWVASVTTQLFFSSSSFFSLSGYLFYYWLWLFLISCLFMLFQIANHLLWVGMLALHNKYYILPLLFPGFVPKTFCHMWPNSERGRNLDNVQNSCKLIIFFSSVILPRKCAKMWVFRPLVSNVGRNSLFFWESEWISTVLLDLSFAHQQR